MSANRSIAATEASNKKGGQAVARAARIQDLTMLSIAERTFPANAQKQYHTKSGTAQAYDWLKGKLAGLASPRAEVVELTPDLAAVLLERNPDNRKIKARRVDDFARDMLAGNWKLNGEPIIVSSNGELNDGQHRCAAVVASKVPVLTFMVFGVTRDSQDTLDHGTARSPGDDLALHGHTDTVTLAAAARMLWQWRQYGTCMYSGQNAPTRVELMQTVDASPGLSRSVALVSAKGPKAKALGSVAMLAFCHFAFRTVAHETDVAHFFDALVEGENLKRGDPILNARNRLITDRSVLSREQKIELIFRAWNAHRKGETTRQIFRLYGGELPMLEA